MRVCSGGTGSAQLLRLPRLSAETMSSNSKADVQQPYEDLDRFGRPRIPHRGYYDKKRCDERRAWVENFASCSLEQCGQWWINEGRDSSCSCTSMKGNIENPIGLAKMPLAVCGPLLFEGETVKGYYLCPFATTEGALVASVTRGATAVSQSGGVYAKVLEQTQIRSPYFRLCSIKDVDVFSSWIFNNFSQLKDRVSFHMYNVGQLANRILYAYTVTTQKLCSSDNIALCQLPAIH